MPVYVDPLFSCPVSKVWRWSKACHLYADTLEELHSFASRIGMRRAWYQDKLDFPHYDLNESRRAVAVREGAIEVGRREVVQYFRSNRAARLEGADTFTLT